jgi:broad specificity phosphatase PhoE
MRTEQLRELWLIRHGETEWTISGAHTGRTDIPLTARGKQRAHAIAEYLKGRQFSLVLTSPLGRAQETCRIAGFGNEAVIDPDLCEWDYGAYEGLTTAQIRAEQPGWVLWEDGVRGGETIEQVAERARRVIDRSIAAGGSVALFAHGHFLRILAACWVDLPPREARVLALGTGSVSTLGFERDTKVVLRWNRSFEMAD